MSRSTVASLLTALAQPEVEPFFAVELLFDTRQVQFNGQTVDIGPLRMWTGGYDKSITINGTAYDFVGSGSLLHINGIEEVADLAAKNIEITLSGIPTEVSALALGEPYQRRICNVYFGCVGVTDVIKVFAGKMDTIKMVSSATDTTFILSVESQMADFGKASNWRYTDESHQKRHPGDTFFSYVQDIQDKQFPWGRKS